MDEKVDYSKPSACEQHSGPIGLDDPVTQVVMTETQKELLTEIRVQYERRVLRMIDNGVDPKLAVGNMTVFLPHDLLREAFTGEPPVQSIAPKS